MPSNLTVPVVGDDDGLGSLSVAVPIVDFVLGKERRFEEPNTRR